MKHAALRFAALRFVALAAMLFPAWCLGDSLDFAKGSRPLGQSAESSPVGAAGDDPFLPVEEAYRLVATVKDGRLELNWQIAPGYYLYKKRFSAAVVDGGQSTPLNLSFEPGVTRYDDYYEEELEVYYGGTRVVAELPALEGPAVVKVGSQGCADAGLCYPPRNQYLNVDPHRGSAILIAAPPAGGVSAGAESHHSLPVILAFALAGGLILNLMPCVFPVLSIKVLSLTSSSLTPHRRHFHGLAYSAGVIAAFVVVALALIALRAGGQALGWGFQLQSPLFVSALIYLFFVMGLSFSGYFQAGSRLMSIGQSRTRGEGLNHSFLTGMLATVVASPCSAPFMGTALGFALTQAVPVALLVFIALGLGMALPFLLLTWAPGLMARLPKPGPWMETLKEVLAFPLYLTCIWLLWILGHQTGTDTLVAVTAGLVLVAFAIWLGKSANPLGRGLAVVAVAASLVIPVWATKQPSGERQLWEPYSEERLDSLLADHRSVFVNLTADWCITCLVNERVALSSDEFANTLAAREIVYLKGDWTNQNPEITALLNAHGRSGVPLYLYFPEGRRPPHILPQILTKTSVINALTQNPQR